MRKHFDFVIENETYRETVFRYYPKQTHVHGFGDESPKNWKEVYKVYYSWAIIDKFYDDEEHTKFDGYEFRMKMGCDECSVLPYLDDVIRNVIETGKAENNVEGFGQPSSDWSISKRSGDMGKVFNYKPYEYYDFTVFDNWQNNGYRFTLDRKQVEKFCKWLDKINTYALAHGEGM